MDFDPKRFEKLIQKSVEIRDWLKAKVKAADSRTDFTRGSVSYKPAVTVEALAKQGREVRERIPDAMINPDIQSRSRTFYSSASKAWLLMRTMPRSSGKPTIWSRCSWPKPWRP